MDGEELTAQETALYDRQIRVWGADAQRRLSKSHILVSGINGTIAEVYNVQFLLGDLASFGEEFFDKFDAVIISCCSATTKVSVNEKCRKRSKRIAFYTVNCRDLCGEIFVDLQNYTYAKKKDDDTIECKMTYPSFEEAVAVPWKTLPRKVSKLYFAMRVIERFELAVRRSSGETSIADLPSILELRKELCEAQSLKESHIPEGLIERLAVNTKEHPAVCAIIGGILGQEVIKSISGKGVPLKNFFFFDAIDGKGIIEDISSSVGSK